MPWMAAAAAIGGSLLSSSSAEDAANNATNASSAASAASIAEQRRQYDLNRADMAPYTAAGTGAVNRLGLELVVSLPAVLVALIFLLTVIPATSSVWTKA